MKRKVELKVNPGEPTDGTGQVCIHLFLRDESGPFVEPHVLHESHDETSPVKGRLIAKPTRGRLACDRTRQVKPVTKGNVTLVTPRTDDPRAVTCPKCMKTTEYAELISLNGE